jgi:hypothetical protein
MDGLTILALGGAVGYMYQQRTNSQDLVSASVQSYRAEHGKPAAPGDTVTSCQVRGSLGVLPVEQANLSDLGQKEISGLAQGASELRDEALSFDERSGAKNVPAPSAIEGVYLNFDM